MRNKYLAFILIVIFFGCNEKKETKTDTDEQNDTIKKEIVESAVEKESVIEITQPINIESSNVESFINKEDLIREFISFWGLASSEFDTFNIKIVDSLYTEVNQNSYKYVKFEIKGSGMQENSVVGFEATANKLLLLIEKEHHLEKIHETKIFQPECGTEDFSIGAIDETISNFIEFAVVKMQTHILGCCGSSDIYIDSLVFFQLPNYDYYGALEYGYQDENNDYCSDTNTAILRESTLNFMTDTVVMKTITYKGAETDSVTKYLFFKENGIEEIPN